MWGKRRRHNASQQRSRRRGPVDAVGWQGGGGHGHACFGAQAYDGGRSGLTHRDRRRGSPLGWPSIPITRRARQPWLGGWNLNQVTYCGVWRPSSTGPFRYRDVPATYHGPDDFVHIYGVGPWYSHE